VKDSLLFLDVHTTSERNREKTGLHIGSPVLDGGGGGGGRRKSHPNHHLSSDTAVFPHMYRAALSVAGFLFGKNK